jgi:hypothetical protein
MRVSILKMEIKIIFCIIWLYFLNLFLMCSIIQYNFNSSAFRQQMTIIYHFSNICSSFKAFLIPFWIFHFKNSTLNKNFNLWRPKQLTSLKICRTTPNYCYQKSSFYCILANVYIYTDSNLWSIFIFKILIDTIFLWQLYFFKTFIDSLIADPNHYFFFSFSNLFNSCWLAKEELNPRCFWSFLSALHFEMLILDFIYLILWYRSQ